MLKATLTQEFRMFASHISFARFTPVVRSAVAAGDRAGRDERPAAAAMVRIGPDGSWLQPRSVHALLIDGLSETASAEPRS
jgi:hypothetical protein